MDFEASREAQNSTNATGHVNLVEVKLRIFRVYHVKLTKSCNSTTNWSSSSDKIFNP